MQGAGSTEVSEAWLHAPFLMSVLENELLVNRIKEGCRKQEIPPGKGSEGDPRMLQPPPPYQDS